MYLSIGILLVYCLFHLAAIFFLFQAIHSFSHLQTAISILDLILVITY